MQGRGGEGLSLNAEVCQGLALKDREQTSQPSIIAMVAAHHVEGKGTSMLQVAISYQHVLQGKERGLLCHLPDS